jgi:hypothetical protein
MSSGRSVKDGLGGSTQPLLKEDVVSPYIFMCKILFWSWRVEVGPIDSRVRLRILSHLTLLFFLLCALLVRDGATIFDMYFSSMCIL